MMDDKKYIAHSDDYGFEETVKELLLFRRIIKVERLNEMQGVLTLDNGTQLIVEGNEGCGGCGNGWFDLYELNDCDNAITNVKCETVGEIDEDMVYNIFVFAEDKRINCVQYRGYDNGYYGTGYDLFVRFAGQERENDE